MSDLDPKSEGIMSEHTENVRSVRRVHEDGTTTNIDVNAIGGELDQMPRGYYYSASFIGTLTAVSLASIAAYLGWVLPANTLLLINNDLGPSPDIGWAATVWTLGTSIGFLLVGRLSDIFGRKWMVMSTNLLGLIGCIIGAVAKDVPTLIGGNVCNGLAAAGQLSFGIVIGELVPMKYRGPVTSFIFFTSLPFAVFGPIIARKFIQNLAAGWRWSYYIGIIITGLDLILFFFFYHPPSFSQLHVGGKTKWQQFKSLDFVGIFLFCASTVLFLFGLSWGGVSYPWKSLQVLCTLIIGGCLFIFLFVYEAYICPGVPIIPPRLFRSVKFNSVVIIATVGAMIYYSLTVLWPTILTFVFGLGIVDVGIQSSVVGGGILLGQLMAGFGLTYIPKVKIQCIVFGVMVFAFMTSLISISPERWASTIALGVLATWATGYIENISYPGVTLVCNQEDIGLAAGVLGSIRALGGAVAQALYSSVLNTRLAINIPKQVGSAALKAGLKESALPSLFAAVPAGIPLTDKVVPGMTDQIAQAIKYPVRQAYADSMHYVFYATIPFSVLLLVACCFVPNMDRFLKKTVTKKLQGTKPNMVGPVGIGAPTAAAAATSTTAGDNHHHHHHHHDGTVPADEKV